MSPKHLSAYCVTASSDPSFNRMEPAMWQFVHSWRHLRATAILWPLFLGPVPLLLPTHVLGGIDGIRTRPPWSGAAGAGVWVRERPLSFGRQAGTRRSTDDRVMALLPGLIKGTNDAGSDVSSRARILGSPSPSPAPQKQESGEEAKKQEEAKKEQEAKRPAAEEPSHRLIKGVSLEKTTVCAGEPFLVEVQAFDTPGHAVDVFINDEWGSPRVLSFNGLPGKRYVFVAATTNAGASDSRVVTVNVSECKNWNPPPRILSRPNPFHADVVDFRITQVPRSWGKNPLLLWDFGDGKQTKTTVPAASHNYVSTIDPSKPYTVFMVRLTAPGQTLSVRHAVTFWNQYYFTRRRGFVRPAVDVRIAARGHGSLTAEYSVVNLESGPLSISSVRKEYQSCDVKGPTTELSVSPKEALGGKGSGSEQLVIGSRQTLKGQITLSLKAIPDGVCVVGYHLQGKARSGDATLQAYGSFYLELKHRPALVKPLKDPQMLKFLTELVRLRLVPEKAPITDEDLYRLSQEGKICRIPSGWRVRKEEEPECSGTASWKNATKEGGK